ncbi:hypothetical protein LCGC14_1288860, partial [marine sediment metagenome]
GVPVEEKNSPGNGEMLEIIRAIEEADPGPPGPGVTEEAKAGSPGPLPLRT